MNKRALRALEPSVSMHPAFGRRFRVRKTAKFYPATKFSPNRGKRPPGAPDFFGGEPGRNPSRLQPSTLARGTLSQMKVNSGNRPGASRARLPAAQRREFERRNCGQGFLVKASKPSSCRPAMAGKPMARSPPGPNAVVALEKGFGRNTE